MWFELSLISLIFLSFGYMFSGMTSGGKRRLIGLTAVSGLVMGAHAVFMLLLGSDIRFFTLAAVLRCLPVAVCRALCLILLFYGAGPAASRGFGSASVFLVLPLCFIFGKTDSFGENTAVNVIGTVLILAGTAAALAPDIRKSGKIPARRLLQPALYCALLGLCTYADGRIVVKRGAYGSIAEGFADESAALVCFELTFLVVAAAAVIYLVLIKKEPLLDKEAVRPAVGAGLCAAFGMLAYFYAIADQTARVSALVLCAPAVSLLWRLIFLKEKQPKIRYAALLLIAAGMTAYAIAG